MKKICLLILLVFTISLCTSNVYAQYCTTSGGFTINPPEGCAPLTVQLKNLVTNATNVGYYYNYDKVKNERPTNINPITDSSFTYSTPGTYTILQVGSANATGFNHCNDIKVLETRAPKAKLITCNNGKARISLEVDSILKSYDYIQIDWLDGSAMAEWRDGDKIDFDHIYPIGSPIPSIIVKGVYNDGRCATKNNSTTFTGQIAPPSTTSIKIKRVEVFQDGRVKVDYEGMEGIVSKIMMEDINGNFIPTGHTSNTSGIQTAFINNLNPNQNYRFKLETKDICDNLISSPIVSSLVIQQSNLVSDEIIAVEWKMLNNSEKLVQFQLKRDGVVVYNTPKGLSYLDKDAKCGKTYRYEVIAQLENNVISYSTFVDLKSTAAPPEKIVNTYLTVTDDGNINTTVGFGGTGLTGTYDLIVERSDAKTNQYAQVSPKNNQNLTFEDEQVSTATTSYCYRFSYQNACNLTSPASDPICSIHLGVNSQGLNWSEKEPFLTSYEYYLVKTNAIGSVIDEKPMGKALFQEIKLEDQATESFSYKIKAVNIDGMVSFSNLVMFDSEIILEIPDVFTPNHDGINDVFEIKSYFSTSYEITIYDRWGKAIFNSKSPQNSWNGQIGDKLAAAGYYIFKIKITDNKSNSIVKNGSLLLIR